MKLDRDSARCFESNKPSYLVHFTICTNIRELYSPTSIFWLEYFLAIYCLKMSIRSFRYAAPCLCNQLSQSFRESHGLNSLLRMQSPLCSRQITTLIITTFIIYPSLLLFLHRQSNTIHFHNLFSPQVADSFVSLPDSYLLHRLVLVFCLRRLLYKSYVQEAIMQKIKKIKVITLNNKMT